jgi:hypothetical protein
MAIAGSSNATAFPPDYVGDGYTYSDKCRALAIFAETNSINVTSARTGIPPSTLYGWSQSEEGDAIIKDLRAAVRAKFGWEFVEVTGAALSLVRKNLEEGDEVVTRNGTIIYKRVSALDSMKIAAMAVEKHAMITGQLEGSRQVDKALGKLAETLLAKVQPTQPKPQPNTSAIPTPTTAEQQGWMG